jgi:hypothetical protein
MIKFQQMSTCMFLLYLTLGMMTHLPIERLIEDLKKVFAEQPEGDERTSKIKSLLGTYVTGDYKDWGKYVFFNDVHYTRNLVEMTDNFELMVNKNHIDELLLLINMFPDYMLAKWST